MSIKDVYIASCFLGLPNAFESRMVVLLQPVLHSVVLELLYYVLNRRGVCKEKKRDMKDHQQTTDWYIVCTPIIQER